MAAKTKNPQSAQITNNIIKTLPGGKILSLTDMHGRGLRLKVMSIISNKIFYSNEQLEWIFKEKL